jgi:hypothetical protein
MVDSKFEQYYWDMAVAQAKAFHEVYFVRHNPEHDLITDSIRQGPAASKELQPLWDKTYKEVIDANSITVVEGTAGELLEKI